MKHDERQLMTSEHLAQARLIGERINRLRLARNVLQSEAAIRAGISRPTATRIEAGDPGRTLSQVIRYLDAIAPGMTLLRLLQGTDPSLTFLAEREKRRRARPLTKEELKKLDF